MMRNQKLILTNSVVMLVLLIFANASMAIEKETIPLDEYLICPSEVIHIVGDGKLTFQFVQGGDTSTAVFQVVWRGTGYGMTSGNEYRLSGKWMDVTHEVIPPIVFVLNDHFQLTGKGDAENYAFSTKIKFIVNANGDVIVDDFTEFWPCG
jgi:hypothetical protein